MTLALLTPSRGTALSQIKHYAIVQTCTDSIFSVLVTQTLGKVGATVIFLTKNPEPTCTISFLVTAKMWTQFGGLIPHKTLQRLLAPETMQDLLIMEKMAMQNRHPRSPQAAWMRILDDTCSSDTMVWHSLVTNETLYNRPELYQLIDTLCYHCFAFKSYKIKAQYNAS